MMIDQLSKSTNSADLFGEQVNRFFFSHSSSSSLDYSLDIEKDRRRNDDFHT